MANRTQSRPHPEMSGGVAWMPVSLQPKPEKPAPSLFWGYLFLAASCLFAGILISQAHQNYQLEKAQKQAEQAISALKVEQQAKAAYCKGVSK